MDIHIDFHRIHKIKTGINYYGPKLFNFLPQSVRDLPDNQFKNYIKNHLIRNSFYSIDEYFNYKF